MPSPPMKAYKMCKKDTVDELKLVIRNYNNTVTEMDLVLVLTYTLTQYGPKVYVKAIVL